MHYEKVYVEVVAKFLRDGGLRPLEIVWADGKRYSVERVKFIERKPSKVGSLISRRYTVTICGLERYIYFETDNERWFVERSFV